MEYLIVPLARGAEILLSRNQLSAITSAIHAVPRIQVRLCQRVSPNGSILGIRTAVSTRDTHIHIQKREAVVIQRRK